jgi:exopolysaccharide biosynthesis WecB/TagA/CpsF family protein
VTVAQASDFSEFDAVNDAKLVQRCVERPPEAGGSAEVLDLRSRPNEPTAGVRRVRLGCCLVDLVLSDQLRRILDGHLGRPRGTGTLLVASANLDHIAHFSGAPDGEALDPGRMDDWLVLLDGAPLVRAARRLTGVDYPCQAGSDLLPELLGMAEARQRSVGVLGGAPELVAPLGTVVRRRWPDLRLVSHLTPSREELLDPQGARVIEARLAANHPDLLIVGLGKPLQERWMAEHARRTGALVAVAFGAAIDFVAESRPRAPRWMRERGLEWAFRLWQEPRRLSQRYLVQGPPALMRLHRDSDLLPVPEASDGSPTVLRKAEEARDRG